MSDAAINWMLEAEAEKARADRAEAACAAHESVGREIMAERDQALACCAEMRACIEALQEWEWDMPDHLVSACAVSLSPICGKGWLSPGKAKELEATIDKQFRLASEARIELGEVKARNQRLMEAIRRAQLAIHQDDEYEADAVLERALAANQKEQA